MARKRKAASADAPFDDRVWRARDDLSTLTRAAEIQRDRSRLAAARAEAKRQVSALESVTGRGATERKSRRKRLEDVQL